MTYGEIRKKSKKQLFGIRFGAICSLAAFCLVKLFFLLLRFALADFLILKGKVGGIDLAFSTSRQVMLCRTLLFFSELAAISSAGAALLGVYCRTAHFRYFKCLLNLIKLRLIVTLFKLPYLVCVSVFLFFAKKIFLEYNAQSRESAIAVIALFCALCFFLMYLYLLIGLFVSPLLIAQGDSALCAAKRSQSLMKGNRARLLGLFPASLPEAILVFYWPQIVMRFAVLSGDIAHIYSDDI